MAFKLDPNGNETALHSFTGADGNFPFGALVRDSEGNLYGTTTQGGSSNSGVVFRLDPNFNETVLYNFPGGATGDTPIEGLFRDNQGNLYGAGGGGVSGGGVLFKLTPTIKASGLRLSCIPSLAVRTACNRTEIWFKTRTATCMEQPMVAAFRVETTVDLSGAA